jgi:hypothetical protein
VTIDLRAIGWQPPVTESNHEFFKDISIGKLMAVDGGTRVNFLTDDLLVVYNTRQKGKDWQNSPHVLQAFFIRAADGSLVATKDWTTRLRKDNSDRRDSEARLTPLADGRFLLVANGTMNLCSSGLELLNSQKLEPDAETDFWNIQSVNQGGEIFLRHESRSQEQVTFSWLDSDTLALKTQTPPYPWQYEYRGMPMRGTVAAGEQAVFALKNSGVVMLSKDEITNVCVEEVCREGGHMAVLSSHLIALTGRTGISVFDTSRGLQWSKVVSHSYDLSTFQFGAPRAAMSGGRFAFWIVGAKKVIFDGVQVTGRGRIFVYDAETGRRVYTIPLRPKDWDFDFALSPDGTRLAIFDGAKVRIYGIE